MANIKISALAPATLPLDQPNTLLETTVLEAGQEVSRRISVSDIVTALAVPDPLLLGDGSAGAPTYSYASDPDTGIYSSLADTLEFTLGGSRTWIMQAGSFIADAGNGPAVLNEASTATNPTLIPALGDFSTGIGGVTGTLDLILGGVSGIHLRKAGVDIFVEAPDTVFQADIGSAAVPTWSFRLDGNTGIYSGGAGSDELKFSAGGVEALSLNELNSGVIQSHQADVAITAFAGGGQGSAVQIDESYNVLSVVATGGDSVKLPPVFAVNSVVYIKNDGANGADVFPASGDDLGAGVDTAVSVATGGSLTFIATVADSTWTQLIGNTSAAGGSVFKVGTPVNDQIGVWTGDGTLEGVPSLRYNTSLELFADSIVLGDLESVKIRESLVNTLVFRFSNFDRWRADNLVFSSAVTSGGSIKQSGTGLTTPSLMPRSGDENTGIGSSQNDAISIIAGGVAAISISESAAVVTLLIAGDTFGTIANGFGLINENASATNPSLIPNRAEEDTGIGQNASGEVSLIGGGVELARAVSAGSGGLLANNTLTGAGIERVLTVSDAFAVVPDPLLLSDGSAGAPTYSFTSDTDIGMFRVGADLLGFAARATLIAQAVGALGANQFVVAPGAVQNNVSAPDLGLGDGDTGVMQTVDDTIALVAGANLAVRYAEASGSVIQTNSSDVGLTASVTQTQAGGLALLSSYNEASIVGTTGDALTAFDVFQGSRLTVVNNGANDLQLFPAVGDDFGAGVDAAITIEAGEVGVFLGRDSINWDVLFSGSAAGGDVFKVGTPVDNQVGIWTGDGTIEGDSEFLWDGSALTVGFVNAGPQLLNEVATDTNPTIVPTRNDPDTGIGHDAADRMALIAGGVTVAHVQESSNHPVLIIDPNNAGTGAPELGFGPGGDTGFRETSDVLFLILGGVSKWGWDGDLFVSSIANGAGLLAEVASATNPTFIPNRADLDSGIGQNATDEVSLIGGGVELARAVAAASGGLLANNTLTGAGIERVLTVSDLAGAGDVTKVGTPVDNEIGVWTGDGTIEGDTNFEWTGSQLIIGVTGSAAAPAIAFGDGDSGFLENVDDTIRVSLGGVSRWFWEADSFNSELIGPAMLNLASGALIPGFVPKRNDPNTGLASGGNDILTLPVGGVEALRLAEVSSRIIQTNANHVGLTASVTQTQGGGLALLSSYNEIATVANEGDALTAFAVTEGIRLVVINNGANGLQLFPASGDDIGAGVNAAITISANSAAVFLGRDATNWDQLQNQGQNGGAVFQGLGTWRYRTEITSPPASGQVRFNNADPTLATEMFLAETNANGTDVNNFLDLLTPGAIFYIQDKSVSANFFLVEISSNVDNGTDRTFGIANIILEGDEPSQNTEVLIVASESGAEQLVFPEFQFFADQLENPNNADWTVNALAPASADSNNAGLTVRLFDDTTEEGVGFTIEVPADATNIVFDFVARAETAPGAVNTVGLDIYNRGIPDNAAVQAWSASTALTDIDIPTNEFFQEDTQTVTLATLGVTAGETTQFELVRTLPGAGTDLTGDWDLLLMKVSFT